MTPELDRWLELPKPSHCPAGVRLAQHFFGFERGPLVAHEVSFTVWSRRGAFTVGRVEWSPQWRAWMFRPNSEAVFPLSGLAEIYKFMRDLGGRQV